MFATLNAHTAGIYFLAAVLPAVILLVFIYRHDRIEKEPPVLLAKLLIGGVLAALLSIVLETAAEWLITFAVTMFDVTETSLAVMDAFSTALIEEITKFLFLYLFTWRSKEFNYRFDGIVYAVFASLGFAAFENILYVFFYGGIEVALPRALLSVPAHMTFGVYMGALYGRAKAYDRNRLYQKSSTLLRLSVIASIILHTIYDGALMIGSDASMLFFFGFVIVLDVLVFLRIRHDARKDTYIP